MQLQNKDFLLNVPTLVQINVPLHDKNWFRTGGAARYYTEPTNADEFQKVLIWAYQHNLPIFMLGEGANILISDDGFEGLVIRPQVNYINIHLNNDHYYVTSGAGVSFNNLIQFCLDHNLIGLHEFSGIPGTVGGSVFINIHYFEFLLSHFLTQATVINRITGELMVVDNAWFNFGYNQSTLQQEHYYLVDATFKVNVADTKTTAYAQGRRDEMIRYRNKRYPTSGTCGSFFRNFYDHEVTLEINGKKIIYAAFYLDKIGVKGQLSVGNAIVSHQHANMLFNKGNASSQDLINLAHTMQKLVLQEFGILLQPECQFVGFSTHPLLIL